MSIRRSFSLLMIVQVGCILLPQCGTAQTDSLADCFPLAIGNQWVYRFDHVRWDDLDPGTWTMTDTGTALYSIVGKSAYPDSTVWTIKVSRAFHRWVVVQIGPRDTTRDDSTIIDTTTFDLVELQTGRHDLYRQLTDDPYDLLKFETGVLWNSAFPFQRNVPDSARMYRYHVVDSTSTASLTLKYKILGCDMDIAVRQDSGMMSLLAYSTITLWFEHAHHQLVSSVITSVADFRQERIPLNANLLQNYPNPFNPTTTIAYTLPRAADVLINVYDLLGNLVARWVDAQQPPGRYFHEFDATHLASGLYFCRLQAGTYSAMRKLVLLR